ncbi:MAG: ATP-binding protein [Desulfomonilaceae bacterium]|nr:ATP-binding protein [Desulfomonilaceae bacterium]
MKEGTGPSLSPQREHPAGAWKPHGFPRDSSISKRRISRSASVLVVILVIFSIVSAYMLYRLYHTSSQLAESNRKAFILETKNKTSVLEAYFAERMDDLTGFAGDQTFQTYFVTSDISATGDDGLDVVTGPVEQKLLLARLAKEERGNPVYSRMAFYDIGKNRIVARTDFSPKGRWIKHDLFRKLRSQPMEKVNMRVVCRNSECRIFLFGPVIHKSQTRGVLLMELSLRTIQDQIQLLTLQKPDHFSGLIAPDGTLVLGPPALIGKNFRKTFGVTTEMLREKGILAAPGAAGGTQDLAVTMAGAGIAGTKLTLVQVAPTARFVGSHLPLLWGLVFMSLMGALALVLVHIYGSYAERTLMYDRLRDAHDHLEIRVKERTAELEQVNQQLRLEVTERRRAEEALRTASEELKAANRELKDFAHVVSHDLKAPLRSVRQLVQWLLQDYGSTFDETAKRYSDLLIGRVDLMHNLIEGILRYSRVGQLREDVREVDLNRVVQEVISLIDPPASIRISFANSLPSVQSEPTLLHEVFQNLIDNAVKYMDKPDGEILISCEREDNQWLFGIADNGPGIAPAHFDQIFEIFKALSPSNGVESTGIGLALVKKIVEQKGGRIWVESEVGRGSTFRFTLPDAGGETS